VALVALVEMTVVLVVVEVRQAPQDKAEQLGAHLDMH
jgi:hypothetical protein